MKLFALITMGGGVHLSMTDVDRIPGYCCGVSPGFVHVIWDTSVMQ